MPTIDLIEEFISSSLVPLNLWLALSLNSRQGIKVYCCFISVTNVISGTSSKDLLRSCMAKIFCSYVCFCWFTFQSSMTNCEHFYHKKTLTMQKMHFLPLHLCLLSYSLWLSSPGLQLVRWPDMGQLHHKCNWSRLLATCSITNTNKQNHNVNDYDYVESNHNCNRDCICLETPSQWKQNYLHGLMWVYCQTTYDMNQCDKCNY